MSYIQSIVMNQGSSSRVLVTCGDLNDVVIAQGIVMDLASAGLPPSVAGIVGLNILSQYDVEFHFLKEQIAFYAVGAANRGDCDMQGLQKLALAPVQYALPGLQVRYNSDLVYVYICSLYFQLKCRFCCENCLHIRKKLATDAKYQ